MGLKSKMVAGGACSQKLNSLLMLKLDISFIYGCSLPTRLLLQADTAGPSHLDLGLPRGFLKLYWVIPFPPQLILLYLWQQYYYKFRIPVNLYRLIYSCICWFSFFAQILSRNVLFSLLPVIFYGTPNFFTGFIIVIYLGLVLVSCEFLYCDSWSSILYSTK